jgi:hypothetical protein
LPGSSDIDRFTVCANANGRTGEVTMGVGWTPLAEPRRLTAGEQALLDRLVAYAGCAELIAQAASARVTAVCECGCPSVLLDTDAPALSRATMLRMSAFGRDDWFAIDYTRYGDETETDPSTGDEVLPMLQIIAHVTGGSLHELEIFAGEGVAVDLPSPDELDEITVQ